jgi:fatty-acyl-CoA synthase
VTIARWLEGWARQQPHKTAVHFEGRDFSYADMAVRAAHLAGALRDRLGVEPGDRVAHLGTNSPELLDLVFACARLGAILVPLNWRLAPPEHDYILDHCRPRVLFAERELARSGAIFYGAEYEALIADAAPFEAEPRGDVPLLLVYTSGTTGKPKGAVLTQSALFWNAVNSTHAHDLTSRDHVLTALPMFHVGGLNIQTLPALQAGATVTIQRRFEPGAFLDAVEARRPTLTLLVPATLHALYQHPRWRSADLSSLRLVMTGSSVVPEALIRPFLDRGVPIGQIYGSTETCPIAVYLRAEDAMRKVGSAGKPAIHCEVRLDDGEILLRGPNVMTHYWDDPEATREALQGGWFRTGDVAEIDDEGFYWIRDRKKDLIISGGENIYPAELEAVLANSPDIAEAAVIARRDARWGEIPVAVVVQRPGAALDEAAVLSLFAGRLARFKHPRAVVFVDALPRNAMGKVQKFLLREMTARTIEGT